MTDLTAAVIENADVSLHELFHANLKATGQMFITMKTFRNCRLLGPAVMLPVQGCSFDRCDFGDSQGDMNRMLFKPLSPEHVTGGIVIANSKFFDCTFYAVGFAGDDAFLKVMAAIPYKG